MRKALPLTLALVAGACGNDAQMGDMSAGPDMAGVADLEPGPPDLMPLLPGTRLATGEVQLVGTTSDDRVIYYDENGELKAVPLAGGTAVTIDAASEQVLVTGKTVFSWANVSGETGELTVWTGGAPKLVSMASKTNLVGATADAAWILYTDKTDSNGDTADIVLAKGDGTAAKTLVARVAVSLSYCVPVLGFAGGRGIFTHCPPPMDMGQVPPKMSSVDPASGNITLLADKIVNAWEADTAGKLIVFVTEAGEAKVVPPAGGAPTQIDTGVADARITPDGTAVVYVTKTEALKRSATTSPAPMTLAASGVPEITFLSPDAKTVLFLTDYNFQAQTHDLWITSATTAGAPKRLVPMTTAAIYYDAFTSDSSRAIFFSGFNGDDSGALQIVNADGNGVVKLSDNAWIERAGKGSLVVYNDNYNSKQRSADVSVVDAASPGTPKTIAIAVDEEFLLSPGKDKLLYTYTYSGSIAAKRGLYVVTIP